ncbi:MAG: glycoside hydrolase family 36 protein [Alkalispirochaetaceae bacterium]
MLSGDITNHGGRSLRVDRLTLRFEEVLLPGGEERGSRRFFKNGYQSWSESRSFGVWESEMRPWLPTMIELQDNPHNLPPHRGGRRRGTFRSDFFCLLGRAGGPYLLAGQLSSFNQFLYLRARLNRLRKAPYLEIIWDCGGQQLPPHASVRLDEVLLRPGQSAETLQATLYDRIRERLLLGGQEWSLAGRERPQAIARKEVLHPPAGAGVTGWCSWYYYFTGVTMDDLRRNLRHASRRQARFRYVILDDGYSRQIGDWLDPNEKFSEGLGEVARTIREHGYEPGIWIAPFIAGRGSSIYRHHRSWFLRHNGPVRASWNPHWGKDSLFYCLDLTNPEVQAYLRRVIHTLTREYGFTFLKLDFLYAAAAHGRAWDQRYTPAERLKLGYDIIRESAGTEVFLLGCGSPLPQAAGRVNAMRIGPDVAPFWFDALRYHLTRDPHASSTSSAIRSAIVRSPAHRRLWLNDPDCLMLRDRDILMNETERLTLAQIAAVTGGLFILSDRLDLLTDEAWERYDRLRELAGRCSEATILPLELAERQVPRLIYNEAGFLALYNPGDRPQPGRIELATLPGPRPKALREFWGGEERRPEADVVETGPLPPHGSRIFELLY